MVNNIAEIDLSEYQNGQVDIAKLAKETDFVILRVQAGSSHADVAYKQFVADCEKYNIPFSTYSYFKAVSISDAHQEAKDAIARMDHDTITAILDIEAVSTKIPGELVPAGQAFIDDLHNAGFKKVGLYSGENFYNTHGLHVIKADFLWIASYGLNNDTVDMSKKPSIPCDLWQYTSKGHVDAIKSGIDKSILIGSKALSYFTQNDVPVQPTQVDADSTTTPSEPVKPAPAPVISDTYIVQKGDTLSSIAAKFNLGVGYLQHLNGIPNANIISVGQVLKLKGEIPAPAPKPAPTPAPSNGITAIGKVEIVNANAVFVMNVPNRDNSKNMAVLPKGTVINISGSVNGENNPQGYYEVIYNNQRGYVSSQFCKKL